MYRARRVPMRTPKRMARGVGTRWYLLAGCMVVVTVEVWSLDGAAKRHHVLFLFIILG
jgi:hypothetical protein